MLKYKLFKWFGGLVLVFGIISAAMGIWMIDHRVIQEAQTRVSYDLSSAWAVYNSQLKSLETIIKLTARRNVLVDAFAEQKWQDPDAWQQIRGILAKVNSDEQLDFIGLVDADGRVVDRAAPPYNKGDYLASDPLVAKALAGGETAGTVVMAREELAREGGDLPEKAFLTLRTTARARATPRDVEDRGMAMVAAAPIEKNGRVLGVLYGGILLNRNQRFVDQVQGIVFGHEKYDDKPVGTVTVFLSDTRIATTVLLPDGNRALGTRVSSEVADRVLDNDARWAGPAFVVQDWYLTAYDPIRDPAGRVIGMLYVGTLQQPFTDLGRSMIFQYSALVAVSVAAAMVLALVFAGKVARPLHRLAEAADRMRHGQPFEPVDTKGSSHESAGLINAFNEMAVTLRSREQELRGANEQLGSANASLTAANARYMETLQFVSHELNSPLSSITNYTYMLRQKLLGPLTDKQQNALDITSGNLRRVMEMIRHYLNLARIESGDLRPMPTRVALREQVIAPILQSLEGELAAKGMVVEDLVNPRLHLHSDLNMTREVFENLLSNAVKYGRPGGRITLSCEADGTMAALSVRNEGAGIPPEKRAAIFEKFARLDSPESRAARGTGLGLFIARRIVQAHGGEIRVDSAPGEWAEFVCTFPLDREDHAAKTK
jgi:two-component system NtrC family sensor kinase